MVVVLKAAEVGVMLTVASEKDHLISSLLTKEVEMRVVVMTETKNCKVLFSSVHFLQIYLRQCSTWR